MSTLRAFSHPLSLCALLLFAACESSPGPSTHPTTPQDPDDQTPSDPGDDPGEPLKPVPGDDAEDFLSHVPGQSGGGGTSDSAGAAGGATADAGAAAPNAAGSAERAIAEADILKRDGDLLYALSRYAGLSVIDMKNPAQLELLGSHRANATPFEMYLENSTAYIMYNSYGQYAFDADANDWVYRSTSRVSALDVSDPADIKLIGDHEVPGNISDSRLVGDILYLVTYEDGYCWGCDRNPNTRVASFDISDPAHFDKVDEVRFEDQAQGYSQRSIAVTTERIYVGGPTWQNRDSNIQIVDIHDPEGDLRLGAEIPLHGSIESRWQMDEHEGVLRVISQPTPWRNNDPPYVQTFRIESSDQVTKLASLAVKLPRPENLRSVRFDGARAYAITFQQVDPLFTFDLSDPAHPKQVGELEIPGFVYHMEPRGDRVYALGYDFAEKQGSLHVSIFDVSTLDAPKMVSRVNFGGSWAQLAEDQDRIQKAFNILLDQGLILVPFSGGDYDQGTCYYRYQSGIQLIDVDGDALALRGVAPQVGNARRALIHRDHLFGITDNAVSVFNIDDRDHPTLASQLEVARNISQVRVMGDTLLRFGSDWWTKRAMLDFTTLNEAGTANPVGQIDLSDVADDESTSCNGSVYWDSFVYVHGDTAYVPRRAYRSYQTAAGNWASEQTLTFYIVDLSDRSAPTLAGTLEVESSGTDEYLGGVVLTDHALLVGRGRGYYSYDPDTNERAEPKYFYDIYDLEDPLAPAFTERYQVPSQLASGGFGYGFVGCGVDVGWGFWFPGYGASGALVSGDLVVSQHEESVDDGTGRVRYYLDRLDVSDPSAPKLLPAINIPGQLVHFDGERQHLVTLDYLYEEIKDLTPQACYGRGNAWLDQNNVCRSYNRRANALVLEGDTARRVSMLDLDSEERRSGSIAVSDQRLFYMTTKRTDNWGPARDGRLESLAFNDEGQFVRLPSTDLADIGNYWGGLFARGERAFMTTSGALSVVDTRDQSAPKLTRYDMQGWGCSSLEVNADRAYCALGEYGVFAVDL